MAYAVAYPVTRAPAYAAGNALLGGSAPSLQLSASSFPANSTIGTVIGTLSVLRGTGSYTYSLTSNPGSLFSITTNQLKVANASIAAGSYPVTIKADNGAGSVVSLSFTLVASGGVALKADFSDTNANEAWGFW